MKQANGGEREIPPRDIRYFIEIRTTFPPPSYFTLEPTLLKAQITDSKHQWIDPEPGHPYANVPVCKSRNCSEPMNRRVAQFPFFGLFRFLVIQVEFPTAMSFSIIYNTIYLRFFLEIKSSKMKRIK